MSTIRALLILIACLFPATGMAQTSNWRLADADQIASSGYVILTVPLADEAALRAVAQEISQRYDLALAAEWPLLSIEVHCLVLDARDHPDIDGLLARMRLDAQIRTAQPMQEYEVFQAPSGETLYMDPLLPSQEALRQLNAVSAHLKSTGAGIRIGVIDSGIDQAHPDLVRGVVDLRDFVRRGQPAAAEAHGTAIAGLIGADGDNASGIVGVAPDAEMVGLRACWQPPGGAGRCSSFSLARALNFAILNDMNVLNMSLGGRHDPLLAELIESAIGKGIVIVAAWGEADEASFPASMPGVIAASRRRYGGIPAPYTDVISTAPGGRYRFFSGSSVAAAHVSGVVALLLEKRADLKPQDVEDILSRALRQQEGGALLDACAAVAAVTAGPEACAR
ncbi:MAG: S8 family serine peptidase [Pseudomonadota bacterium]